MQLVTTMLLSRVAFIKTIFELRSGDVPENAKLQPTMEILLELPRWDAREKK